MTHNNYIMFLCRRVPPPLIKSHREFSTLSEIPAGFVFVFCSPKKHSNLARYRTGSLFGSSRFIGGVSCTKDQTGDPSVDKTKTVIKWSVLVGVPLCAPLYSKWTTRYYHKKYTAIQKGFAPREPALKRPTVQGVAFDRTKGVISWADRHRGNCYRRLRFNTS